MSDTPKSSTGNSSSPRGVYIVVALFAVAMIATFFLSAHLTARNTVRQEGVDALLRTQVNITLAHLRFEETMAGDTAEDIIEVWYYLYQAETSAEMLHQQVEANPPWHQQDVAEHLHALSGRCIDGIVTFRRITQLRHEAHDAAEVGTPLDQEYDDQFGDLLADLQELEAAILAANAVEMRTARALQWGLFIGCLVLALYVVRTVHRFTHALRQSEGRLRGYSNNLESMVEDQTSEIREKHERLQQAFDQLKQTQSKLVQSEKMAQLGNLLAGVSHEINTPLGAIRSANDSQGKVLERLMKHLPAIAELLSDEKVAASASRLFSAMASPTQRPLTTRERRALKSWLTERLEQSKVADAHAVAAILVDLGDEAIVDDLAPIIAREDSLDVLAVLRDLADLNRSCRVVDDAVGKCTNIVAAMSNYMRREPGDEMCPHRLSEGIYTILTLYNNQIKHGIDLHLDMDDNASPVLCHADELNQVWTNLLQNALQAIDYQGRVDIALKEVDGFAQVTIRDGGPGIAPEIQEKVFEPLFTTKEPGKGTGLGLDICRRIVEKHHGQILVESRPGEGAAFIVRLPLQTGSDSC